MFSKSLKNNIKTILTVISPVVVVASSLASAVDQADVTSPRNPIRNQLFKYLCVLLKIQRKVPKINILL